MYAYFEGYERVWTGTYDENKDHFSFKRILTWFSFSLTFDGKVNKL